MCKQENTNGTGLHRFHSFQCGALGCDAKISYKEYLRRNPEKVSSLTEYNAQLKKYITTKVSKLTNYIQGLFK